MIELVVLEQSAMLRAELKRRGVKYEVYDGVGSQVPTTNETMWEAVPGGPCHKFDEYADGQTRLTVINPTAAQAIDATLGKDACVPVVHYHGNGDVDVACECGWWECLSDAPLPLYCRNCGTKFLWPSDDGD